MDKFFDVVRVSTFKSEIFIKLNELEDYYLCKDICNKYIKNDNIGLILEQILFLEKDKEFLGVRIVIVNNPLNPEEENILKKYTFTLAYKLKNKLQCDIYCLYKDTSFSIINKSENKDKI